MSWVYRGIGGTKKELRFNDVEKCKFEYGALLINSWATDSLIVKQLRLFVFIEIFVNKRKRRIFG